MQLEVGKIYEGKVTGIIKFGAFVELEPGKSGMVHISEVAPTFVQEISDHVQVGQTVKVKVLNIAEDGKISLSIKKAMEPEGGKENRFPRGNRNNGGERGERPNNNNAQSNRTPYRKSAPAANRTAPSELSYAASVPESKDKSFEDMLSRFMQKSDEKMSDLKKTMDTSRRSYGKKNK